MMWMEGVIRQGKDFLLGRIDPKVRKGIVMNEKRCPICHRCIDEYEMNCICGYEFGSNRCTNPQCRMCCGDFVSFCSNCGWTTENYLNGYIQGIPTNVFQNK